MTLTELQEHLHKHLKDDRDEFTRLFHGRGGLYENYRHLTIDSLNKEILSVALYFEEDAEDELLKAIENFAHDANYTTLVVQRRYLKGAPSEILFGEVAEDLYIIENTMKFKLNLLSNKNNYYFPDMKNGRAFIRENAKGKKVLNLFAYTCAFSVAAKFADAKSVVNVDMSKSALSIGKANHALNDLDPRGVSYLPYNILKSFSSLKRKGPYDLIIIDPPTFQRGSFEATKDYEKLIKKLPQLASEECIVLSSLNSPDLDADFVIELFKEWAPSFAFEKRLDNLTTFESADEQRSLKNLVFRRKNVI